MPLLSMSNVDDGCVDILRQNILLLQGLALSRGIATHQDRQISDLALTSCVSLGGDSFDGSSTYSEPSLHESASSHRQIRALNSHCVVKTYAQF